MNRLLIALLLLLVPSVGMAIDDYGPVRPDADVPAVPPSRPSRASFADEAIPQAGGVDPRVYRVGPGDVFELRLWGRLARTVELVVDPEGRLSLPERAPIMVGGRTLEDVRRQVLEDVARVFRGVDADLKLTRVRRLKVYISGDVREPGAVVATPVTRVSEVLAVAALTDRASQRNILVRHLDGSTTRADLALFRSTGDTGLDPALLDGDVIDVPVATRFVSALGAFGRPGRYELAEGDRLGTLVRIAGGYQASADRSRGSFTHFVTPTRRDSVAVDLRTSGGAAEAMELSDGDAVFVPFVPGYHELHTVTILGEVGSPGAYPIELGRDRLSDLLRWAGGLSPRADEENLYLVRRSPTLGEGDPDFERLVRLSRDQMTESEYSTLQLRLAERKNSFRIDWKRVKDRRMQSDLDLVLSDGDLLRVDPLVTSVRVDGQVRNPGLVEFVPGRSPQEYIRLAGGLTKRASNGGVRLTRRGSAQVLPAGSVREVQPGDVIWVPERRDFNPWIVLREVIAVAAQVAVIIVAVRR